MIGSVRRVGPAEQDPSRADNVMPFQRHPAAGLPERIDAPYLRSEFGVAQYRLSGPKLGHDGTAGLVEACPKIVAGGVRVELDDPDRWRCHGFLSGLRANKILVSNVTASAPDPV